MSQHRLPRSLVSLRPRIGTVYASHGSVVLATKPDGTVAGGADEGMFVDQTRLLSRLDYRVDGKKPQPIALSSVEQHSWMGYYGLEIDGDTGELTEDVDEASHMLEMRVTRNVLGGLHEDIDLVNYSQRSVEFELEIELGADFADISETEGERTQHGEMSEQWMEPDGDTSDAEEQVWALEFRYVAEHDYDHQGESGTARIDRAVEVSVEHADSPPRYADGTLSFDIKLEPKQRWHTCVLFATDTDGKRQQPEQSCGISEDSPDLRQQRRRLFLDQSTRFSASTDDTLSGLVVDALDRSTKDLASLRMYEFDEDEHTWIMAAGMPIYVGIFGRDVLTTAWQAAIASPDMMRGSLGQLARLQGTEENDWRDEQPGRMLHQRSVGPVAALHHNPFTRYYGSLTTSGFYPFVVAELWHWTGDAEQVEPFVEPALEALRWLDKYADSDGDGLYEYRTVSEQGIKNQGWKDSHDAIVYRDGSPVPNPIATCEEQGFVYAAKLALSEVLWWLDRKDEAKRLFEESRALKKRFNEAFWMPDEGFLAMALDPDNRQVKSIGSNAGHCIATGIVDSDYVETIADRLFEDDLFSGWGIRTLSADHVAYNPYSYHRGSIWPVEHGSFALGLIRYGLHDHAQKLSRAMFEAASCFEYNRLPEVFSGHTREADHPFPALYPDSNWPQAWSASAVFCFVQSMLGLYAYAPLNLLLIDPQLPEWMPDLTVKNLEVGEARITLEFSRQKSGSTDYRILEKAGPLHVVRQPSPQSLTAGYAERVKDVLTDLLPRHRTRAIMAPKGGDGRKDLATTPQKLRRWAV
jgi:glycogen debranching enzyme